MALATFSTAGETLYTYLTGEIDHDAAQELRIQIDYALTTRQPKTLVIDFSGVTFMDSSGVGLILGRKRRMSIWGGEVRLQNAPAQMQRVLELTKTNR